MPIVSSLPGVFDSLGGQSTHDDSSTFVKVDAVPFERKCCVALAFCIAKKLNIAPCEPQVSATVASLPRVGRFAAARDTQVQVTLEAKPQSLTRDVLSFSLLESKMPLV